MQINNRILQGEKSTSDKSVLRSLILNIQQTSVDVQYWASGEIRRMPTECIMVEKRSNL